MEIPSPFLEIIEKRFGESKLESDSELKDFVNNCMQDLIERENLFDKYQKRAKKTGDMFEYIFYYLMKNKFGIDFENGIEIPKACMMGGGSLDFGLKRNGEIICGVETKGSAERMVRPDGRVEELTRAGLKRTDTTKKAISTAYQFYRAFQNQNIPFYLVTNVKPTSGNSKCMLDLADGDIINEIIDITNFNDLIGFKNTIKML